MLQLAAQRPATNAAAAGLLLALVAIIVYIPSLNNGFIWDDDSFLTRNKGIRSADGPYQFWFTARHPDYFPLTSSMLWLEWRVWGANPVPYHAVNIILHALSAVLLWRALRRLAAPGAWFAALLFAIHPVNVESVAWITERKNVLSLFFCLLSALFYLRFDEEAAKRWHALSIIAFLLALLSKTAVAAMPLALLLCVWRRRGRITAADVGRIMPFLVLACILGAVTLYFQATVAIKEVVVRDDNFPARLAGAGWALCFYLEKALFPVNLSFIYSRWQIDPAQPWAYLPLAAWIALLFAAARLRNRIGRGPAFALLYFTAMLLPALGFVNIFFMLYSFVADHWQYFSLPGIIALIVAMAARALRRFPRHGARIGLAAGAAAAIALAAMTWQQQSAYRNVAKLWPDVIRKNPAAFIAYNNHSVLARNLGEPELALALSELAVKSNPMSPDSLTNRGVHYSLLGNTEAGVADQLRALELDVNNFNILQNLGNTYMDAGRFGDALAAYDRALEINPARAPLYGNRAAVYARLKEWDSALADLDKALELDPTFFTGWVSRGSLKIDLKRYDDAVADLDHAIKLNPWAAAAYLKRGLAYYRKDDIESALGDYARALELEPDNAEARHLRAIAYRGKRAYREALDECDAWIKAAPHDPQARFIRATIHFYMRDFDAAWANVRACREHGGNVPSDFIGELRQASGRTE